MISTGTPIKATDRRFTIIANIIQKIREGTAKKYPGNDDPILAAVRETWLRIEELNPNEGAVNRGIAYYQAAVTAMRTRHPDGEGRFWTTAEEEEEHIPEVSTIERYEGVDFAAESPAIAPSAAEEESSNRSDPYHNPPLQEKAAPNAFAELVREFAEATQRPASVLSSIKEESVSVVVPDDYDALPEAQAGPVDSRAKDSVAPASNSETDGGLHEWLAQYQDAQQGDGGTSDDRLLAGDPNSDPSQGELLNAEPPSRIAHEVETNSVVIGFKREAAEMLVRMIDNGALE
ncbi:hypothetical protein [Cupriavidus gilardii]|uniref:hypothetical protein n=1 Tax=Cupriavidus gilardii TaxID=82541 RepID=UPI0015806E94|nr:hypothetical protein [Cupriavidus gilardii]QKS64870.1 hypothetical protein FOB47_24455 [Cupriavidus gilardii]